MWHEEGWGWGQDVRWTTERESEGGRARERAVRGCVLGDRHMEGGRG